MKRLEWGETPWDNLPRGELLREVQRMFSALEAATSVLGILRAQDAQSLFWARQGSGGRAFDRALQVVNPVYELYDAEAVYRSFFRYAASLLFDVPDDEKWVICPVCGSMWGGKNSTHLVGTSCQAHPMAQVSSCAGVLRWLEWDYLQKEEKN